MKIHFIGIGGIGVSALAGYYLEKGNIISGSDLNCSEITEDLKNRGAKIIVGEHKVENISESVDLVVFSPAVIKENPEMVEAEKRGISVLSYPQALGELTKKHYTIAVSGTHGKSTTTSMLGLLLKEAGLDPTIIVGTKLKELDNRNYRVGNSKYLVIEADEHFASFLNYYPDIIVLTNIEKDHLDYYKNLKNILKTFKEYITHLKQGGFLVVNKEDKNIKKIAKNATYYSLKQKEAGELKLQVPGKHNILNALAVLAVARLLNIQDDISFKSLSLYQGAWRRFEEKEISINGKEITLISDYGHHPTEVLVTLIAVREKYREKNIICVFQPHQYQRTYYLFSDFVKAFKKVDINKIIITDIYDVPGREENEIKKKVNSEILVKKINKKNVIFIKKQELKIYLQSNLKTGDVLIVMGAGDIYTLI